jgi:hypothetical protein
MAHEIADALTAAHADGHGSPAADRARRLILDVWTHRTAWPYGWPPEQAVRRLRALAPAETLGEREADAESPWLDQIAQLQRIAAEETRLWIMAGLLQTGVDAETGGVNLALDDDDDVWALRRMVDLHDQATRWAEEAGASEPGAIHELVVGQMGTLADERRRLLDAIIAAGARAPDDGGGRGAADEEGASGASPA